MYLRSNRKRLVILVAVLLIAAIVLGIVFLVPGSAEPVGVYPFVNIGMTEFWGDNQESHGPVSSDKIQTVFLTDTQIVTEVLVKAGDTVKKGDILMTFDTTLSTLELERKRLDMEKAKLQLEVANGELMDIRNMVPMKKPEYQFVLPQKPVLGEVIDDSYQTKFIVADNDGTSQEKAFVCWLQEDVAIDDALLEMLRRKVFNGAGVCEHNKLTAECEICTPPVCKHGNAAAECDICNVEVCQHGLIKKLCKECTLCRHGNKETECDICNVEVCRHGEIKALCKTCTPDVCIHGENCQICNPKCTHGNDPAVCGECVCAEHGVVRKNCPICTPAGAFLPETQQPTPNFLGAFAGTSYKVQLLSNTEQLPGSGQQPGSSYDYYVVFKTTEDNYQRGTTTLWQGVHVSGRGRDFSLGFFTPSITDYTVPEGDSGTNLPGQPEQDMGSGLTYAQIAQLRKAKEEEIKKLEIDMKMKETEYKIMRTELEDGNVYASVDGEVLSALTEEEARASRQPILKVSGGGGFYVDGSISELAKDQMQIGQEVTVNDWNTGMTYTGTVESIGDFPSAGGYWNGMGNPNTTYYPFRVFIDGSADLQTGTYVSISYSTSQGENGIFLEKPFIRTEQGRSYVYVLGPGSKLVKREVITGRSLWGSYTEILSGVSKTDLLAFPYGKEVRDGAPAVEKTIADLYKP